MRTLAPVLAVSLPLTSCSTLADRHVVTSTVLMANGGNVVARVHSQGADRISMRLENRGPASVVYRVRDELDQVLEEGELQHEVHAFEWRPLARDIVLVLEARGAGGTALDYRLAGRDGVGIELDLTHALRTAP